MFVYTARKNYYINYKNVLNEKHLKYEQKVGMLLQKRADTRVGISSMRKSIYSAGHQESKKEFFHSCTFSQSYFMLLTNKTYQHDPQSLLIN